jgi:hypothetical protein
MTVPESACGHELYRSTVVEWTGSDSKINFDLNIKDATKSNIIYNMGFDKPGCITYTYNSRGFRDREFDNEPSGIALGCSFTKGVGIPAENTWPAQLSNLLKTNIWNLGVGGGSLDTAYNILEHYLDELNVQFVVLGVPPMDRFEFFCGEEPIRIMGNHTTFQPLYDSFIKEWFATEKNSLINQRKNVLAMQQLCNQRRIPFYHLYIMSNFTFDRAARDCTHAGVDSNLEFAVKMHNKMTGDNP